MESEDYVAPTNDEASLVEMNSSIIFVDGVINDDDHEGYVHTI